MGYLIVIATRCKLVLLILLEGEPTHLLVMGNREAVHHQLRQTDVPDHDAAVLAAARKHVAVRP